MSRSRIKLNAIRTHDEVDRRSRQTTGLTDTNNSKPRHFWDRIAARRQQWPALATAFETADGEIFRWHVGSNQWSRNSESRRLLCRESDATTLLETLHELHRHSHIWHQQPSEPAAYDNNNIMPIITIIETFVRRIKLAVTTGLEPSIIITAYQGDVAALLAGQQTCNSQVAVQVLAGHHCVVALVKLLTPVCLCYQAV